MAKLFVEGEIRIFVSKSFTDSEGKEVEYNEVYALTEQEGQQDVLKLKTTQDLATYVGQRSVFMVG